MHMKMWSLKNHSTQSLYSHLPVELTCDSTDVHSGGYHIWFY